ncbi:hypothetical protein RFI_30063 [Reticulomyxa filosa]|uniref:Uncharacterized protein n=1 Tax=Reticulomyxa filosa TaxID=46433 RepID=X6LZI0_RETFI|nr:hypothetical protein RFI_30063 [Reticulomyxa filosa]|eukprot:ETO07328.1 hypothetical protein RFI_30063 [Reticulomyxa filosa]
MLDTFYSSLKLLKILTGPSFHIKSIDYSIFDGINLKTKEINHKTIRFWDVKDNQQLQIFNEHKNYVYCVEFSSFNGGSRYLCSASNDCTIPLWDIETSKPLHVFHGMNLVFYQSCFNSNVICSGPFDNTIRFWDIRSNKKEVYTIKGDYKDNEILCFKFLEKKAKIIIKLIFVMAHIKIIFEFWDNIVIV